MNGFPGSPRLVRGGIVIADPVSLAVRRVIALQYNPDTLTRTVQAQGAAGGGERSEALRLVGPPVETIKLDAELDATDALESAQAGAAVLELGLHPQLAALESLLSPTVDDLVRANTRAGAGSIEIAPAQAPLSIFVWGAQRVLPVRITDFSVVEDAFDVNLNPMRARLSITMRVLSVDDLGFSHPGGNVYLGHLQRKQVQAGKLATIGLSALGIGGLG